MDCLAHMRMHTCTCAYKHMHTHTIAVWHYTTVWLIIYVKHHCYNLAPLNVFLEFELRGATPIEISDVGKIRNATCIFLYMDCTIS